jgi:hypothetical protein
MVGLVRTHSHARGRADSLRFPITDTITTSHTDTLLLLLLLQADSLRFPIATTAGGGGQCWEGETFRRNAAAVGMMPATASYTHTCSAAAASVLPAGISRGSGGGGGGRHHVAGGEASGGVEAPPRTGDARWADPQPAPSQRRLPPRPRRREIRQRRIALAARALAPRRRRTVQAERRRRWRREVDVHGLSGAAAAVNEAGRASMARRKLAEESGGAGLRWHRNATPPQNHGHSVRKAAVSGGTRTAVGCRRSRRAELLVSCGRSPTPRAFRCSLRPVRVPV